MSLYLGTTQIYGVATGDAAVTIIEEGVDTSDATATANDIASGKTAYVNGEKVTGTAEIASKVAVGEITLSATETSITIPDIIGKDNVALMYMDSCSCPASRSVDAGLVNVIIHGENYSYNVHYYEELYVCVDDGFIQYDKTIGKIDTNSNMRYNEFFIAGKYIYVAW